MHSIAERRLCPCLSSDVTRGDIAEVQTAEGKLRLFVAIHCPAGDCRAITERDRTSKFTYAELHEKAGKMIAAQFLRNLVNAVPYAIHTVLTDNSPPRI